MSGLLGALALVSTQSFAALYFYPTANATVEGGGADTAALGAVEQHFQQVFNASLLTDITPGSQILGIAFRVNGGSSGVPAQTLSNFEIRLSESANVPGHLSTFFAQNRGADEALVRSGPLAISAGQFPGGSAPNAFGEILFNGDPYFYNGGNLLIEVAYQGFALGREADAVFPYTPGLAQVAYGTGYASTSADAGIFDKAIVFGFSAVFEPVPEPAHTGLIAAGILGVCITARHLRNRFQGRRQSL